jgi:O-antigen ligase
MLSIVGSRTGFITFLTVTTLLLLMRSTGVKRYLSLFILTGIFFVLFLYKDMWISILSFLSPYMGYGIDMALSNRIEELQTITDRLQFWLDDINYFYLSPIFGVGPGYGFMERSFSDNTYIYLLARYGIVGFLTYLFSLLLLYKWAHRNRSIFLYAVLISFIVFGLTAEVFLHNLILYYLSILFFTYNFKTKDMKSK